MPPAVSIATIAPGFCTNSTNEGGISCPSTWKVAPLQLGSNRGEGNTRPGTSSNRSNRLRRPSSSSACLICDACSRRRLSQRPLLVLPEREPVLIVDVVAEECLIRQRGRSRDV